MSLPDVAAALRHAANNWLMVLVANLDMLARKLPEGSPEARQLSRAAEAARRLETAIPPFTRLAAPPGHEETRLDKLISDLAPLLEVMAGRAIPMELEKLPHVALPRPGLELALLEWAKEGRSLALRAGPELECRPGHPALAALAQAEGWTVSQTADGMVLRIKAA
jgi:hypothetical protein